MILKYINTRLGTQISNAFEIHGSIEQKDGNINKEMHRHEDMRSAPQSRTLYRERTIFNKMVRRGSKD